MIAATPPSPRLVLLVKSVQAGHYKHSGKYVLIAGRWHKLHQDKPAPKGAPVSAHPHAAGAPVNVHTLTDAEWEQLKLPAENVNAGTFNKQLEQLKQAANAGDVTGIVASGYGVNTYGKKLSAIANHVLELMGSQHKVSPGQKAGEHAAVQTEPEIEAEKPAPTVEAPAAAPEPQAEPVSDTEPVTSAISMPVFEEGKTTSGVKAYYEKVAQKVLALAAAGDAAGLEAMKAAGLQPNSKGKVTNTWAGKTANSKMLLDLHAHALKQAAGASQPAATAIEPAPEPKQPRLVVPKKPRAAAPAAEPVLVAASPSKVDQIPWGSLKLPDSNKNAKSHNGKVEQIKAMAYAGDVAGLEAFKAGTNTYGKQQNKLAQTALAALKESAPQAAAPTVTTEQKAGIVATKVAGDVLSPEQSTQWEQLTDDEKAELIVQVAAEKTKADMVAEAAGPKEGDTKQGADGGTLIFKNGRWHKQEQPPKAETAQPSSPNGIPTPPEFTATGVGANPAWAKHYATVAQALYNKVQSEGPTAFKGVITNHADGAITIKLAGFKLKKIYPDSGPSYRQEMHAYVAALKTSAGKPPKVKKTPKAVAPAPVPTVAGIEPIDGWTQTGSQGGSNPGGRFKDPDGVEWYCKFPSDPDVAKSEVLAAKLYAALGIAGQDAKLVTQGGKIGIASRWVDVKKASSPAALAKVDGVRQGFGADAWLGNWDVVGLGYDNLQVGADGKAMRVDAGGSLTYRAQGGKKAFGTTVTELDSLRDPAINPQAAAVFGGMTQADVTASVAKVLALPDASIKHLVELYGPGDAANKKALAEVLIARKADLAAKFPKAAKPPKKRLDPNNLPVKEDRLPKPHDFNNWLGQGKPLSSQPHVNAANMAVEQEMLALAKTGNLTKLKDFKFHAIDKATGNATGEMIPIAQHPSKHVVQLHADLVQMLDEIANPPQPLKVFQETDVSTLDQLAATLPPKKFGTTVNAVHSNEKLGFWVVLGTAHGAAKFAPKKVMDYSQAAIKAGYEKFKQGSKLAKHFITSVQASGAYNDLFRIGKETDQKGYKLSDVAQAAFDHASSQPEGTTIYRWQNMPDEMVKKIMAAPDGTVFQATGPMCTSYSPTSTSGFGQHRVVIRYAQGAKGVDSFGSGNFQGEKEITTLPNSRFVILGKKMVPSEKSPGKQRLELEVLMLPPDLGV